MNTEQKVGNKAPDGMRRRPAPSRKVRRVRQKAGSAQRTPAPEVAYIPPRPVNRMQMILRLLTVAAVVAAISFGMSIFFKVKNVTVSGADKYTAWEIREASGIKDGDNLLFFGKGKASGNILAELPYVKSVQIGIKLPDTVNIAIEEQDTAYAIQSATGGWWLISAQGKVLENTDIATAASSAIIKGVMLDNPGVGQTARAAARTQPATEETEDGEETTQPETYSADMQLQCALTILQELEKNGMISGISTLDVTSLGKIELWYGDRYQVTFGDQSRIEYKVKCMVRAIGQLEKYQSGVLDVSFTVWPDQVGYTPFE